MSILDLQDLYLESISRELTERTKGCALTWAQISTTQFHATETDGGTGDVWDFYLTKTQIGNVSFKFTLDVKKNSVSQLTIADGPLPTTARDSAIKELYSIVEIMVLQLDQTARDTISFIQSLATCP